MIVIDGAVKSKEKEKNPRSGTSSTGSAGTGSSGGTLVAAGEMYSPATHCNSIKSDMSVTFFSERAMRCEPNVGLALKNVMAETSVSPVVIRQRQRQQIFLKFLAMVLTSTLIADIIIIKAFTAFTIRNKRTVLRMMMEGLKITRHKSLRAQIAEYLREEILRGRIEPGSVLPSTRALSEKWGTQTANVHAALSLLVQEGLITRKNGVGTIVNDRKKKLDTILIYERQDIYSSASHFYRLLQSYIREELDARNLNCRVIYHNQSTDPLKEIRTLVDKQLIQGIILPSTDRFERPWFEKLSVPFSCITSARVKNRVFYNYHSLAEKVVEGLSRQGVERAGLLLSFSDSPNPMESGEKERHDTIAAIRSQLTASGIEVRDEWIYTSDKSQSEDIPDYARYAFDGFNHIWSAAEKPDGLFVFTEDLISGTLIAVMTAQLRIPQDIKLVFHRNTGHTPLCPVPCCFIDSSTRAAAAGLVNLIVDQYHGREIKEYEHEYKLTENNP